MQPFLAMIMPVGDGGGSGQLPGTPTHPWVPPGTGGESPPLGIWGGSNQPFPGYGPVAPQPSPGWPPVVMPPIYYPPTGGTPPLEIWGGSNQPFPGMGLPGPQPGPGRPTHPIYYPPVIWDPSRPTNPIVNPGDPDHPGEGQPAPKIEWKTAWSPSTGWIVVGIPAGEHVTPSMK